MSGDDLRSALDVLRSDGERIKRFISVIEVVFSACDELVSERIRNEALCAETGDRPFDSFPLRLAQSSAFA